MIPLLKQLLAVITTERDKGLYLLYDGNVLMSVTAVCHGYSGSGSEHS